MFKVKRVDINVYGDEDGLYLHPRSMRGNKWLLHNLPDRKNGIPLQDILLLTDTARNAGLTVCIMKDLK